MLDAPPTNNTHSLACSNKGVSSTTKSDNTWALMGPLGSYTMPNSDNSTIINHICIGLLILNFFYE